MTPRWCRRGRRFPAGGRTEHCAGEVDLIDPVAVDLGDEVVAVAHRERTVGAAVGARRVMAACAGACRRRAIRWRAHAERQQDRQFLMSAMRTCRRAGQRVVGVGQVARAGPGHAGRAVAPHDPARRDVDQGDDGVLLLGGDDLSAVRGEERVVGRLELYTRQGGRPGWGNVQLIRPCGSTMISRSLPSSAMSTGPGSTLVSEPGAVCGSPVPADGSTVVVEVAAAVSRGPAV